MSGGVIAVQDSYGDGVLWQHVESCTICGALVFVAANYADGGTLDTTDQHRAWHATPAIGSAS